MINIESMRRKEIIKGFKKIAWAMLLCFIAPIIVAQAFKNEGHPFYLPVLIIGIILIILVLTLGIQGIKSLVSEFFWNSNKKKK